jgi:hypothetical protein
MSGCWHTHLSNLFNHRPQPLRKCGRVCWLPAWAMGCSGCLHGAEAKSSSVHGDEFMVIAHFITLLLPEQAAHFFPQGMHATYKA